jgi:hypothetical protein
MLVLFGAGCSDSNQAAVKEVLGVSTVAVGEKYLGLPTPDGRMNKGRG